MKKQIKTAAFVLSFSMLFAGCNGKTVITVDNDFPIQLEENDEQNTNVDCPDSENDETNKTGENELSEDELKVYTDLFNTPEYKGFLLTPFENAEDIDYDSVFYYGAGIEDELKSGEEEDYLEASGNKEIYGDLFILRSDSLTKYLETHLGVSDFIIPEKYYWDYIESRDTYYYYHWSSDFDDYQFECISARKDGNAVTLRFEIAGDFHYGKNADRILKLEEVDGNYVIKSNEIEWFDFCDETQTFEFEMSDSKETINFITYEPNSNGDVEIYMIKDGKFLRRVSTNQWISNKNYPLKKVNAVSFFDFNADGIDDILITGESDLGEFVILEESVPNEYVYETCYALEEKLLENPEGDLSVSNIKRELLGDNQDCKFDNYKDAYAHIAKIHNMTSEGLSYGLIFADDDDIPELVISSGGTVSLYTFEDNHLTCLMYQWAFGAFGNVGYYYAPRSGVFYNLNNDMAGAIKHDSYMIKHPKAELRADFSTTSLWFNDLDGNGEPSEEEWDASEEFKEYEIEYYNWTDTEMSEEEIKAQIEKFESLDFEEVTGDKSYDDFVNGLK